MSVFFIEPLLTSRYESLDEDNLFSGHNSNVTTNQNSQQFRFKEVKMTMGPKRRTCHQ